MIKKFQPFAEAVTQLCGQFNTQNPMMGEILQRFAENRAGDKTEKHEFYDKKELRTRHGEQTSRDSREKKEDARASIDVNITDGNKLREERLRDHLKKQATSKIAKEQSNLQRIQHVNELKDKAQKGDQKAIQKLQGYSMDAAVKKLRGEKVKDDAELVKKAIHSEKNMRAKRVKARQEKAQEGKEARK